MPLFSVKKREPLNEPILPPLKPMGSILPSFDDEIPSYKPSFPIRESSFREPMPDIPIRKPMLPKAPLSHLEPITERRSPVFVKITKYKTVLQSLNSIKDKLREAEHVMEKLDQIKREEDRELSAWHNSINEIKEKLTLIDSKLFEV